MDLICTLLKIESAVVQQLDIGIFSNVEGQFCDHDFGQDEDDFSSLMKAVIQKYTRLKLKNYGKIYTNFIVLSQFFLIIKNPLLIVYYHHASDIVKAGKACCLVVGKSLCLFFIGYSDLWEYFYAWQ